MYFTSNALQICDVMVGLDVIQLDRHERAFMMIGDVCCGLRFAGGVQVMAVCNSGVPSLGEWKLHSGCAANTDSESMCWREFHFEGFDLTTNSQAWRLVNLHRERVHLTRRSRVQ